MLPHDLKMPTQTGQATFQGGVALDVLLKLSGPDLGVGFGLCGVLLACVPEASSDIYGHLGRPKDDV